MTDVAARTPQLDESARHRDRIRRRRIRDTISAAGFLAPQLIGLIVFMVGPLVFALVLSLYDWSGFGERSFAGTSNFQEIFTSEQLRRSAVNTVWFTVIQVPIMMVSGFLIGLLLQNAGRLRSFYRTLFFAPHITSTVAVAAIWLWLFNPEISPLNATLERIGLVSPDWLSDPAYMIPAFAIVGIWQGLGYQIVMFMAGLANIPVQMYEAAEIDGASPVQQMTKITIPLISPTVLFLSITSIIGSFQVFDYIYVFMGTTAPDGARTIVYEIVQIAFREFRFGLASAVAVCLLVVLLVLTGFQLLAQRRWVHYTE